MTLRRLLKIFQDAGLLRRISAEVDPNLEAASILSRLPETPVLFENLKGNPLRATGNLLASRDLLAKALGVKQKTFLNTLVEAVRNRRSCDLTQSPSCQEKVWRSPDLSQLPIFNHFKTDGGPFVTSSVVVVGDPEVGRNAAFHRMMVIGENRLVVRVVEKRDTHRALERNGGEMPAVVCIGAPPHVMLAAAMSPPPSVDELEVAQALASTPLARCLTNGLQVPAETEIVLEGRFTGEMADEGPFVDLTGTMDIIRSQPVFEVETITSRENAIYEALLPGMMEHKMLMGVPREADIFRAVNAVAKCLDVRITPGRCSWLHGVIQIEKQDEKQPAQAISAAFRAHPSLKRCIVVDPDVNPADAADVEWALATRFQADRDVLIMDNRPSSSLDPSAQHPPGMKSVGSKLGLDATIKGTRREEYTRVPYPELGDNRLRELLGE